MSDPVIHPFRQTGLSAFRQNTPAERADETSARIRECAAKVKSLTAPAARSLAGRAAALSPHAVPTILQAIRQGVLFVSLTGCISFCNEAALSLLGAASGLSGRTFWECFPDDFLGFSMREALYFGIAKPLLVKTIADKELEVTAAFSYEGPKEEHGLAVLIWDLSALKRLKNASAQQERMQELGQLTASVAHELRNPLGGIRGYASLLVRDLHNAPHLQEMARMIVEGTKTLEARVNAILHFARPLEPRLTPKELGALLKSLGTFIRIDPAFPPNVRLEIHIPEQTVVAGIDEHLLKSCLLNLIHNAFQAMPQGGSLTIALWTLNRHAVIAITDTGIGIDEADLPRLFSPFFTTKAKGTGLGLVEARKIAKIHGGSLDVRSRQGCGSTFTLTLPLIGLI